ncbi:hypothetical protein FRC12_007188 [Ceratobasidium sp. 428]|nr:hypothetical protein FRC09_002568 [Ceratobasidium sp. 395]KAG8765940.1 hypothetical protein FRC12_007188 [Ceratobasidium sp. 428]
MVGRSAVNFALKDGSTLSYFFNGPKYVEIAWKPGSSDDCITYGPTEFAKEWLSLKETGFDRIDAILPIPGHDNRAYFFCGDKYARIEYAPGSSKEKIIGGVRSIHHNWSTIKKANFDQVDAAMIVPGTTNQAFIFCRNEYIHVSFKEGTANSDELLDGPHMTRERWNRLGWQTIDTIIPHPTSSEQAYVFSGKEAGRVALVPGGGPYFETGPSEAATYWPSLKKAGFY